MTRSTFSGLFPRPSVAIPASLMVRSLIWALGLAAGLAVALAALQIPAWAAPAHGVALGGAPKYPPGFRHFDYANPVAPKGGRLTLSSPINFDTLNPYTLKGRGAPMIGLVFETLTEHSLDEPFSEYGLVAEAIDTAPDGRSVTFHLNPKARFSDGHPITAADVVFSLNVLRSEEASPLYRYYYADIDKAVALGKNKVRFDFRQPNRELAMITGQLPVLPRHIYEGKDFGRDFSRRAIGSGAYTVSSFEFGKQIVYTRNPDHWGRGLGVNTGRHNFDTLRVLIYRDPVAELEGFKSGEFDFLSVNNSKVWAKNMDGPQWDKGWVVKETLKHSNVAGMQGFVFNTRRPIFRQRQVRRALAMAMDFEWSNRNLFYGQYTALDSYFDNSELAASGRPSPAELKLLEPLRADLPPEVFTTPMGQKTGKPLSSRQRLRAAKKLLNEAGWHVKDGVLTEQKSGLRLQFTVTLVQPAFERITEPFINNLRRLGVRAEMKVVDSSVYERLLRGFDFDMVVGSMGQSQSPGNEQRDYWHSASAKQPGSRNWAGIANPAVDALVDALIAAPDRATLVNATRALDRALWFGDYVVPHWFIDSHRVTYWNRLGKPKQPPLYYLPLTYLEYWWIDPAKDAQLKAAGGG